MVQINQKDIVGVLNPKKIYKAYNFFVIHMYVHSCIHIYVYIFIYIQVYTCMHAHMHIYVYVPTHTHKYTHRFEFNVLAHKQKKVSECKYSNYYAYE